MFVETSGPNIYQCLREGVSGGNLVSLRFFFLFFLWNREDPDANRTASEAPPPRRSVCGGHSSDWLLRFSSVWTKPKSSKQKEKNIPEHKMDELGRSYCGRSVIIWAFQLRWFRVQTLRSPRIIWRFFCFLVRLWHIRARQPMWRCSCRSQAKANALRKGRGLNCTHRSFQLKSKLVPQNASESAGS